MALIKQFRKTSTALSFSHSVKNNYPFLFCILSGSHFNVSTTIRPTSLMNLVFCFENGLLIVDNSQSYNFTLQQL